MEEQEKGQLSIGQRFWVVIAFISLVVGIFLGNMFTGTKSSDYKGSIDAHSWKDSTQKSTADSIIKK